MPDIRFAKITTDPRFRRPRKKREKVVIDDRFKSIIAHDKRLKQSDNYERPVQTVHENDGSKFIHLHGGVQQHVQPLALPDYARGEVLLDSSDEDDDKATEKPTLHMEDLTNADAQLSSDNFSVEVDFNEDDFAALDAQVATFNAANPRSIERKVVPTKRLAAINLDWDHVRAAHLFKICSSLLSPIAPMASSSSKPTENRKRLSAGIAKGKILSVKIYPSEFGKERMAREEIEGPPSEIFRKDKDGEVTIQNIYDVGEQDNHDEDALRNYQLERLRYFYAIITCDAVDAATHVYYELEGTELERTANVFDLSYVPDDMNFDEDFRDQATADSIADYKGVDFVTDALRHSKVKLTWEEDDPQRNGFTRRTLTKEEIENEDFRAYLASSSSESEPESISAEDKSGSRKQVSRDRLRKLFFGGGNDLPEGWNRDSDSVDMQITFTPGLSEGKDETTLDKYQRKVQEKKKRKRAEIRDKALQASCNKVDDDDFFDAEKESSSQEPKHETTPSKQNKRPPSTAEELALLVASDDPNIRPNHFNLKSILKAEKKAYRKRRGDSDRDDNESQSEFVIDVNDERFKVLHEDHQFAIDPSNPHFKKTKAMDAILGERSRRQKIANLGRMPTPIDPESEKDLTKLVKSVKRKGSSFNSANKRHKSR